MNLGPFNSPPPCGEGLGVGVAARDFSLSMDPPPQPSPKRGEGASQRTRRLHQLKFITHYTSSTTSNIGTRWPSSEATIVARTFCPIASVPVSALTMLVNMVTPSASVT